MAQTSGSHFRSAGNSFVAFHHIPTAYRARLIAFQSNQLLASCNCLPKLGFCPQTVPSPYRLLQMLCSTVCNALPPTACICQHHKSVMACVDHETQAYNATRWYQPSILFVGICFFVLSVGIREWHMLWCHHVIMQTLLGSCACSKISCWHCSCSYYSAL